MTDKNNKRKNGPKILKLIIWVIVLGILIFFGAKTCNITLKALTPDATNWQELNTRPLHCVSQSTIDNNLLSADYYSYLSNGNSETGQNSGGFTAFTIIDMTDGQQYDAIYLRTVNIKLVKFNFDINGNLINTDERTIWANDYMGEGIQPDIIRFENLNNNLMASSSVKYKLYDGMEQTGANNNIINSMFLDIINDVLDYNWNAQELYYKYYYDYNYFEYEYTIFTLTYGRYFYGLLYDIWFSDDGAETTESYYYLIEPISFDNLDTDTVNYISVESGFNSVNDTFYIITYLVISDIYDDSDSYIINLNNTPEQIEDNYSITNILATNSDYINYFMAVSNDAGYAEGYDDGRRVGEGVGYTDGYSDGYDYGYDVGYYEGYNNMPSSTNWVLSVMNTATSVLQIEIFPGIKIIYLVGAVVILAFVKFVLGWIR